MPIDIRNYRDIRHDADAKAAIEANLRRLDYAAGNGLLSTRKQSLLQNERYLFISAGGTGQKALRSIKELIEKTIEPTDYGRQVRYLVVDCAQNELNELVRDGVFDQSEVVMVPFQGTHDSINPERILPQKEEWVDPRLFGATGGAVNGTHPGFESNGAGAWRQPGRVRLTSSGGQNVIINKIKSVIGSMVCPNGTKLKVFFLCSVAGGTGSGTIVDLAYMTRHVLDRNFSTLYNNTRIFGYIFSPTACEGAINRDRSPKANHYAAMKEIAYLMRLNDRGEKIRMDYGTITVTFDRNIFDTCVVVDGDTNAFSGFAEPAKTARDVVAQSVLGSMTVRSINGNVQESLIDSVFSNSVQNIRGKIPNLPIAQYPRYAGYSFNAMGFASVKIPVELLTSVLAYEVLKQIWNTWNRRARENDAKSFLERCGIMENTPIPNGTNADTLNDKIDANAKAQIANHGIAYMTDLAFKAGNLLETYISDVDTHTNFFHGRWSQSTRNHTETTLRKVREYIVGLNNSVWEATRLVFDAFKTLLENEQRILTDLTVYRRNFNSTLYFCPINLTQDIATQAKSNALLSYITNDIYTRDEIEAIGREFVTSILCTDKIAEMAGVASTSESDRSQFGPAKLIRDFIEEKFNRIINENIETFLVKFFAANRNAKPTMPDPNNPANSIPTQELKTAANNIYETLTTQGGAMANVTGGIENSVSSRRFITVPGVCRNLLQEIKAIAAVSNPGIKVYDSPSRDELLMITMLEGLPALSFQSITDSEQDYEIHWNDSPGIHIEQNGIKEHNWVNLPNLVFTGDVSREQQNLAAAKADYDRAEALGMVLPSVRDSASRLKMICRLNKIMDVGSTVERLMTNEFDEYIRDFLPDNQTNLNLDYCLQQLSQQGIVSYVDLTQNSDVRSVIGSVLPPDFDYDYAWHTLRQMFHLWHAVKDTIPYVAKLKAAIDEKLAVIQEQQRRAARITTFAQALRAYDMQPDGTEVPAVIEYDGTFDKWYIKPQRNQQLLANVAYDSRIPNSTLYKECREYFAFVAFASLPDADYQNVVAKLRERYPEDVTGTARRIADMARGREMATDFQARAAVTRPTDDGTLNFPMASVAFQQEADRIEPGLCDKIRSFYANDLIVPISN